MKVDPRLLQADRVEFWRQVRLMLILFAIWMLAVVGWLALRALGVLAPIWMLWVVMIGIAAIGGRDQLRVQTHRRALRRQGLGEGKLTPGPLDPV